MFYLFCSTYFLNTWKSGTISGSITVDSTNPDIQTERFEDILTYANFDQELIDFYDKDGTDQDLWTKTIGEAFGNKIRNDLFRIPFCIPTYC